MGCASSRGDVEKPSSKPALSYSSEAEYVEALRSPKLIAAEAPSLRSVPPSVLTSTGRLPRSRLQRRLQQFKARKPTKSRSAAAFSLS
ncbi:hypothetical protein WJX84_004671 [Apatococcus fuscideae]|uniref:Uncharacterized protein n=1 Tax=Apatococcus fuscideae TaxID=2026836 RepID=A0AAW1S194_9CHLO